MRRLWAAVGLIGALAFGGLAHAQAVQQSGVVVPFDPTVWTQNGVVADGGGPSNPAVGQLGLFNGANCPFGITSQAGPGQTTAPAGQVLICQTATTTTLKVQGLNGAPSPALFVNIGGTNYPFPGSGTGNVVGPATSTIGEGACFNNAFGTLLTGCSGGSGGANLTRAQIPTVTLGANVTIVTSGYRTAGDLGVGATYTSVGATSTSIGAIQDAGGTWFRLVLSNGVNAGWFGGYGDNGATKVSSGDLAANPWFRGCYTATTTSWDTVEFTEAIIAAHASQGSTPCTGSTTHIAWNLGASGSYTLSWGPAPSGYYGINQQLLDVANRVIYNANLQGCLNWIGSASTAMLKSNSVAYASYNNLCLIGSAIAGAPYGGAPLWVMDHDGTSPGGLSTQQVIIYNGFFEGGTNSQAIVSINPVGAGSAQGSTIKFIQSEFVCGNTEAAVSINGSNALDISFDKGDFEQCAYHTIENYGGSVVIENPTTENQNLFGFFYSPVTDQFTQGGPNGSAADYYGIGTTSAISTINWNRQEGDISSFCVAQCMITGPDFVLGTSSSGTWSAAGSGNQTGTTLHDASTPGRTFILVRDTTDLSGNTPLFWHTIGAGSTTCHLIDPTASFTPGAFVGYGIRARFFGGFTYNVGPITANDATSITLTNCLPSLPNDEFHINGNLGLSPPTWTGLAKSTFYQGATDSSGTPNGFSTVAGSTTVTLGGNVAPPTTGQWLCIPGGTYVGPTSQEFPGIFCTQLTYTSGSTATMDQKATFTQNNVAGYIGNGVSDGTQGLVWMDLDFDVLHNVPVQGPYFGFLYGRVTGANAYAVAPGRPDWNRGQIDSLAAAPLYGGVEGYNDRTAGTCPTIASTTALPAGNGNDFRCTITGNATFTAPADVVGKGADLTVTLVSNGTPYTVTWGTGFQAGLPTYTTSASSGVENTFRFVLDANGTWNIPLGPGTTVELGKLIGANMNSTADQAILLTCPAPQCSIDSAFVTNPSGSLSTATGGIFAGAAGTNPINASLTTSSSWAGMTASGLSTSIGLGQLGANASPSVSSAVSAYSKFAGSTTVYLHLGAGEGSAATADFYIYGRVLQ